MIQISQLQLAPGVPEESLKNLIEKELREKVSDYKILKRSIDARRHEQIHYLYSVGVSLASKSAEEKLVKKLRKKNVTLYKQKEFVFPVTPAILQEKLPANEFGTDSPKRPLIVGAGPAGYFAAFFLARAGFHPIVIERGLDVETRTKDVEEFWDKGKLNLESNVSFGEGGAGTFSDGKLFTGNKDKDGVLHAVMNTFHEMGAPVEITYDAKPHIGTDKLVEIMRNIRLEIESLGGEVHFAHKLLNIEKDKDQANRYICQIESPEGEKHIETDALILAIGHSARDTFHMLYQNGYQMEPKPFAIGLRVQHPQEMINRAMYGDNAPDSLPVADYKLVYHSSNGRNVFSFCMCPGGYVVNASSDPESMVVNGMSYSGRDSINANSAIVVSVSEKDYGSADPMDAIRFQEKLEKEFYKVGNGKIPVQTYGDFKEKKASLSLGAFEPAIKGQYVLGELSQALPEFAYEAILEAMPDFARKIKGFDQADTILAGVESRTSSPVRINRNPESREATRFPGVFPVGEGAGYAGGITSSAADGIRTAEAVAKYLLEIQ